MTEVFVKSTKHCYGGIPLDKKGIFIYLLIKPHSFDPYDIGRYKFFNQSPTISTPTIAPTWSASGFDCP